ncbi:hypothetical protein B0H63DRAFT_262777 [Podospora didyma]|uniref:Negative regulator of differentiation 1 n=1 Tax=Podospora didyma TaxID=330526 RepID=A0AAE0KF10_9PEZI|nr:hypothetical protein B0H63DRAFT_262777 [Podospora didyma]
MMSTTATTVTIDRGYFDTLVRRAQFNSDSLQQNGYAPPTVTVTQTELDSLKTIAKRYENLRRNLLRGGVGEETVDLLSKVCQDDHTIQDGDNQTEAPSKAEATEDGGARLITPAPTPAPRAPPGFFDQPKAAGRGYTNGFGNNGYHHHAQGSGTGTRYHDHAAWADADPEAEDDEDVSVDGDGDSPVEGVVGANYVKQQGQRQQFERQCTRTVQLMNLSEGTTHADTTNAVRGGILLDVFVRSQDRSATVSFLHAVDARKFFDHVRKHDLYIKNKRVDIKWSERQFTLPGHVAGKIASGASRNLVIRRYDGRHTEQNIRDDLEHIHNLVVVKMEFVGGSCYISTNSVHNAIYARLCMMSRFKYKGTKIEWDVDECAQPYDMRTLQTKPRKENLPQKKVAPTVANRFQLLHLDDDEEDEIPTTFEPKKSVGITA